MNHSFEAWRERGEARGDDPETLTHDEWMEDMREMVDLARAERDRGY